MDIHSFDRYAYDSDDAMGGSINLKVQRKRLQYKRQNLLAKLAHFNPTTSKDKRLQPHITPSTSIDTSGEISLPITNTVLSVGRSAGEEKQPTNRSGIIEDINMSNQNHSKSVKKDGIDMTLHKPPRRNLKSQFSKTSILDTISQDNIETGSDSSEPSDCLNNISDDSSACSSVSPDFLPNISKSPHTMLKDDIRSLGRNNGLQIPVNKLNSVPYAHGGYASAAPLMLQSSRWMLILKHLMPDAHEDLLSLLKEPDKSIPKRNSNSKHSRSQLQEHDCLTDDPLMVMKWAENNPVVTAFGVTNSEDGKGPKVKRKKKAGSCTSTGRISLNDWDQFMSKRPLGKKFEKEGRSLGKTTLDDAIETDEPRFPSIEWDVFLDPGLVTYVDQAMQRVENLRDDESTIAAEIEVDRQVSRLISRMILAHGSTAQLAAEALGMARGWNFSRVVKASEAVRRDLSKKEWSSFSFSCGRSEDATMDDTYTVASRSISFNREASISPPRTRNDSVRSTRTGTDARTGGVFVERWLVLFASALKLGMLNEKTIRNIIHGRRKSRTEDSRKSQQLSASFLRGNQLNLKNLNSEAAGNMQDLEMLRRISEPSEEELFVPTPSCGLFLCLGMDDPGATSADHGKSVMAECVKLIHNILGEPLRLVLDLKSRNVPPRVWGRLIDNLRAKGLGVDAIGSFDSDELRMIGAHTSSHVTLGIFFHSAGDLQRACHANEIKRGDTVYFNAGSLLWKKPSVCQATGINCCQERDLTMTLSYDDQSNPKRGGVKFEPYAFLKEEIQRTGFTECAATLADYQKHFDLKIGLYAQEFAIGSNELNALVKLVNDRPSIYNLGFAWGGLNGYGTKWVQGDGFWNQRYVGRNWDTTARPTNQMRLLAPEDHHLVQKAFLAGQCGQVTTAHRLLDGIFDDDLAQSSICENIPTLQR